MIINIFAHEVEVLLGEINKEFYKYKLKITLLIIT